MKTLLSINVTTTRGQSPRHAMEISHEDWQSRECVKMVEAGIDSLVNDLGIRYHLGTSYSDAVEVVENMLNSSYPNERVYFWLDKNCEQ